MTLRQSNCPLLICHQFNPPTSVSFQNQASPRSVKHVLPTIWSVISSISNWEKQAFVLIVGVVEAWLAFNSPNKSHWPAPDRAESFKGGRALFAKEPRLVWGAPQCSLRERGATNLSSFSPLLCAEAFLHRVFLASLHCVCRGGAHSGDEADPKLPPTLLRRQPLTLLCYPTTTTMQPSRENKSKCVQSCV